MQEHIRNIRRAVKNNANLEEVVEKALASITKSSDLEDLLDGLDKVAFKDPRYLEVYDLLHKHFPQNALIMLSKSLACRPRHCNESVDALIKALVILHQTDEDYSFIRIYYQSLGVQFYLRGEPDKAVALYTLAFSYYDPDTDDFKAHLHCTLYERARAYLYQNKLALARKDVEYSLSHYPQADLFLELLEEIEEKQVKPK